MAIHEAKDGFLWVAIRVPDLHWEDALEMWDDPNGRKRPAMMDLNSYLDTVLEVVDQRARTVVASDRPFPAFWGLTQRGFLFSNIYQKNAIPVVEVWEAQFHKSHLEIQ